jgi:S1-C subfamily serine protease
VLDGMSEPVIITETGERMRTRILGIDNETNIGLLQANSPLELPILALGKSARVAPGHFAVCIGNQAGSMNSVALSTISGVRSDGIFSGRRFYPSLLQISGPVVPGNSGAPVLNSAGEVIGMVVAVPVTDWTPSALSSFGNRGAGQPAPSTTDVRNPAQRTGDVMPTGPSRGGGTPPSIPFFRSSSVAAGYAMPIDAAQPIIADFKAGKPAQHCWIGISVTTQFSHATLPDRLDLVRTVTVNGLYPDSPAHKAGVQLGDQIVSINGRPTREEVDVRIVSMQSRPGDAIQIELLRGPAHTRVVINTHAEIRPTKFPKPIVAENK